MKHFLFLLILLYSFYCTAQTDTAKFDHMVNVAMNWKTKKSKHDSLFVVEHSEELAVFHLYSAETFPVYPGIDFTKSQKDDVIGPCRSDNSYRIYRNAGIVKSSDSVQVSHILIAYSGAASASPELKRSQTQAKKTADSLCLLIQNGVVLLEDVVEQVTDDPGSRGGNKGNYGWFTHESGFVEPFKNAGFANPVGATVVIETQFGYHIIQVEAKTESRNYFKFWEIVQRIDTCFDLNGTPIILKRASYPGGNAGVLAYLQGEIPKYDSLNDSRYDGLNPIINFTVMQDGSVANVELLWSPFPGSVAERQLIQIAEGMKGWTPEETCSGRVPSVQFFGIKL